MWTQEQIERDLPRIKKLPGVEDARECGIGEIEVTTNGNLRHTYSMLNLASVKFRIEFGASSVKLRYVYPWYGFFHWHPTLVDRVGVTEWRRGCLGQAGEEIKYSGYESPYLGVIAVLAVLQTIRAENDADMNWPWRLVAILAVCALMFWMFWMAITGV